MMARPRKNSYGFIVPAFLGFFLLSFGNKYTVIAGFVLLLLDLALTGRSRYVLAMEKIRQTLAKYKKRDKIILALFLPIFAGILFVQALPSLERGYLLRQGIPAKGFIEGKTYTSSAGSRSKGNRHSLLIRYADLNGRESLVRYNVLSGDYESVRRGDPVAIHYTPRFNRLTVDAMEPASTGTFGVNFVLALFGVLLWAFIRFSLPFERLFVRP